VCVLCVCVVCFVLCACVYSSGWGVLCACVLCVCTIGVAMSVCVCVLCVQLVWL